MKDKDADKLSETDSEAASYRAQQVNKLRAIIYPTVCALLLVSLFGGSFIATRMIYDKYGIWASQGYRFDVAKLLTVSVTNTTLVRPVRPYQAPGTEKPRQTMKTR